MGKVDHADYLELARDAAAPFVTGLEASQAFRVAAYLQAVAYQESTYGTGWKTPEGKASNNQGAVHATQKWKDSGGKFFTWKDFNPKTGKTYEQDFRSYDTPAEGWADMAAIVYRSKDVLTSAARGDTLGFSSALYRARYYQGRHKSAVASIAEHAKKTSSALRMMQPEYADTLELVAPSSLRSSAGTMVIPIVVGIGFALAVRARRRA